MNRLFAAALAAALFAPRAASAADLEVTGNARNGQYKAIRGTLAGQPLALALKRIQHVANVGGLLIEQDPSYEITGTSAAGAVKPAWSFEDQIANVGGLHIQTGTLTHVKGTIGARTFQVTIHERNEVAHVGGIAVETDTWRELVSEPAGAPAATLKATDAGHVFAGTDAGKPFTVTIASWVAPKITVSEDAPAEVLVLLVALRPFLAVTH